MEKEGLHDWCAHKNGGGEGWAVDCDEASVSETRTRGYQVS